MVIKMVLQLLRRKNIMIINNAFIDKKYNSLNLYIDNVLLVIIL
jgi:hypothetical protein